MIQGGIYSEEITGNSIPSGGGEGSRTVVRGATNETVEIRPPAVDSGVTIGPNRTYITLDNLVIDGTDLAGWALQLGGDDANTHHIRVQNTEVRNTRYSSGIIFRPSSHTDQTFFELINVNAHNNGWDCYEKPGNLCHGGYMGSSNNTIDGGSYHDHPYGHGIQFYSGGSAGNDNVVKNAKFFNNGTQGLGVYPGNNNQVYNNILYSNGGSGLRILGSNILIYNNTFYSNRNEDINCSGITSATIRNNIFYNSPTQISGCSVTQSNNLTTNPSFVNGEAGNFHLQSNSPAIDAGVTIGGILTDADGISRPQGGEYDIGAYEFSLARLSSPANFRIVAP